MRVRDRIQMGSEASQSSSASIHRTARDGERRAPAPQRPPDVKSVVRTNTNWLCRLCVRREMLVVSPGALLTQHSGQDPPFVSLRGQQPLRAVHALRAPRPTAKAVRNPIRYQDPADTRPAQGLRCPSAQEIRRSMQHGWHRWIRGGHDKQHASLAYYHARPSYLTWRGAFRRPKL
jgi:hypothetical protein